MWYLLITLVIIICYATLQFTLTQYWKKIPSNNQRNFSKEKVAILVAARNERHSIRGCIASLLEQSYDKECYKVYLLDNHSSDGTADMVRDLIGPNFEIIQLHNILPEDETFKKETLKHGIDQTDASWILTIDADCIAPKEWIKTLLQFAQKTSADMVTAPVLVKVGKVSSWLDNYQALDIGGLMVATGGGLQSGLLSSGNGANLLFKREVFYAVGAYEAHLDQRSGDDIFLLQAFEKNNYQVKYLKHNNGVVLTKPEPTLFNFMKQRIRWAAKSGKLPDLSTQLISLLVYLNSLLLITHLFLAVFSDFKFLYYFFAHLILKSAADFAMLHEATTFFRLQLNLPAWMISFVFNPIYIVVVGSLSLLPVKSRWKGRGM